MSTLFRSVQSLLRNKRAELPNSEVSGFQKNALNISFTTYCHVNIRIQILWEISLIIGTVGNIYYIVYVPHLFYETLSPDSLNLSLSVALRTLLDRCETYPL